MIDNVGQWIADRLTPEAGTVTTIGSYIAGIVPGYVAFEVQQEALFYAQLAAFGVSILVGIATLYSIHLRICKTKTRKNGLENPD